MLTPRPSNPFGERTLLTAAKFAFTKHDDVIRQQAEIPGLEGYNVLKIFTPENSNLGFRGVVFENPQTKDRIYAISGTDNEVPDWLSNTNLGLSQFQSTAGRDVILEGGWRGRPENPRRRAPGSGHLRRDAGLGGLQGKARSVHGRGRGRIC